MTEKLPIFTSSPTLHGFPVKHGFFGRKGGVSTGIYDSLNIGLTTGDDEASIMENRARVAAALALKPDDFSIPMQTHSAICHILEVPCAAGKDAPEGDALVTDRPNVGLGIMTGDCAPVLFATDKVIGAAHAGWGGALKGVLENTIAAMEKLGAARGEIRAAIGPCIGARNYEVSVGFEKPFLEEDNLAERFFMSAPKPDKLMFDLGGYCAFRLARAGITRVDIIPHDTLAMEDTYFSHRRTTLRGGTKRGLQVSAITLCET
ncbi:MAG: peptidoglycan editing factor PgeF [Proteobacteria bacterium]|nr:peptidoglycan editing factor PgeF [Pseudomonadota bacterium]